MSEERNEPLDQGLDLAVGPCDAPADAPEAEDIVIAEADDPPANGRSPSARRLFGDRPVTPPAWVESTYSGVTVK